MIKKETRILGLYAGAVKQHGVPVIGVVLRGNGWMDGVFSCWVWPKEPDQTSALVETITHSKQCSQLRAAILPCRDFIPGVKVDISDLAVRIKLPVISLLMNARYHGDTPRFNQAAKPRINRFQIKLQGGVTRVDACGANMEETRKLMLSACAKNQVVPESVRVAKIIASHLTHLKKGLNGTHLVHGSRSP